MTERTMMPVADPAAELPAPGVPSERVSLTVRLITLVVILIPLLAVVAAPFFVWGWGFGWTDMAC